MSEATLKPCPFCGKNVTKLTRPVGNTATTSYYEYTICNNAFCPVFRYETLIGLWQTRPLEDAKDEAVRKMVEALRKIVTVHNRGSYTGYELYMIAESALDAAGKESYCDYSDA